MHQAIEAAASAASKSSGGGSPVFLIILVIAAAGLFYMSSRTRKRQREQQSFRSTLTAGQEVMTASGMLGTVVDVDDEAVTIESTPGAQTRWVRAAISKVIEPKTPTDDEATDAVESQSTTTENGLLGGNGGSIEIPDDLSGLPEDGKGSSEDPSKGK